MDKKVIKELCDSQFNEKYGIIVSHAFNRMFGGRNVNITKPTYSVKFVILDFNETKKK